MRYGATGRIACQVAHHTKTNLPLARRMHASRTNGHAGPVHRRQERLGEPSARCACSCSFANNASSHAGRCGARACMRQSARRSKYPIALSAVREACAPQRGQLPVQ
jgi:hypothetical protein